MKRTTMVAALASMLWIVPAGAATWQVGPNLELAIFNAEGDAIASVGIPTSFEPLGGTLRPGLRIGAWSESQLNGLFLDTGILVLDGGGGNLTSLVGTLSYCRAFRARSSPYLTVGMGVASVSSGAPNGDGVLMGLGIGRRERLGHGHGAVRYEARYERFSAGRDAFGRPEHLDILAIRLGFDLDLN